MRPSKFDGEDISGKNGTIKAYDEKKSIVIKYI